MEDKPNLPSQGYSSLYGRSSQTSQDSLHPIEVEGIVFEENRDQMELEYLNNEIETQNKLDDQLHQEMENEKEFEYVNYELERQHELEYQLCQEMEKEIRIKNQGYQASQEIEEQKKDEDQTYQEIDFQKNPENPTLPEIEDRKKLEKETIDLFQKFLQALRKEALNLMYIGRVRRTFGIMIKQMNHKISENKTEEQYSANDLFTILLFKFYEYLTYPEFTNHDFARIRTLSAFNLQGFCDLLTQIYASQDPDDQDKLSFLQSFIPRIQLKVEIAGTLSELHHSILSQIEEKKKAAFEGNIDVLEKLVQAPQNFKVIHNFQEYNEITKAACSFITEILWKDPDIQRNIIQAYGLLDVSQDKFRENEADPEFEKDQVLPHLTELFPKKIIQLPGTSYIMGYTCYNGNIAITSTIFPTTAKRFDSVTLSDEELGAIEYDDLLILIQTLLHELAHKKRAKYYAPYRNRTPEKFSNESGIYLEGKLFGNGISLNRRYWSNPSLEMKKRFFSKEAWKSPGFLDSAIPELSCPGNNKASVIFGSNMLNIHQTWNQEAYDRMMKFFHDKDYDPYKDGGDI